MLAMDSAWPQMSQKLSFWREKLLLAILFPSTDGVIWKRKFSDSISLLTLQISIIYIQAGIKMFNPCVASLLSWFQLSSWNFSEARNDGTTSVSPDLVLLHQTKIRYVLALVLYFYYVVSKWVFKLIERWITRIHHRTWNLRNNDIPWSENRAIYTIRLFLQYRIYSYRCN